MLNKTLVIGTLATAMATATLSPPASAGDPVLGALVGGGIGAAIGHSVSGSSGAWVGGALGAVTGASIAANAGYYGDGYYGGGIYGPPAGYAAPVSAHYGAAPAYYAPPRVYAPRRVFVRPPVYVAAPVVVVRSRPFVVNAYGPRYPVRGPVVGHPYRGYGRY
jgi:hypothetical protein